MKVRRASLISITQGSFEWFRLPPSCLRWRGGCWLRIRTERFPPLFGCQDTRALFVRSDGEQSNLFSPLDNSRSFGPFVTFFLFLFLPFPRDATDVRVSAQTRAAYSTALGLYTFSISQTPLLSFFFALDTNILYDTFHRLATCLRPEAHCLLRRKSEKSIFGIQGIDVFCATHSIDSL